MSASPNTPFNFVVTDPSLADVLSYLKRSVMLDLQSHHIGTVQQFNAVNQTCQATLAYPKTYAVLNPVTGLYSPQTVPYPLLLDCPAVVLGGGPCSLRFPIQKGDECVVLLNDRDIDNWFSGGAGAAPATTRLHSISDGLILVGLRSLPNSLALYDLVRAVLVGGEAVIGVNPSSNKILLTNATPSGSLGSYTYATSLGVYLQTLMSALNAFLTTTGNATTAAQIATAAATFKTAIANPINIQTALAGLLE